MNYVMLKDVCTINMGQSPDSNSYNDNGDGVPFFQGNADFGERYPVTRKWCSAPTKMAAPEDILISVRAPIGAMNYAKEECCIGRGLAALTPDKSKVSPEFIFWMLKGKNAELNSKGTGSTFKAIGRKVLEETMVPDIPLEKQLEYSEILERVYGIIQVRKEELLKLDELIKARFVEMFGDPITNLKGYTKLTVAEAIEAGFIEKPFDGNHGSKHPKSSEYVAAGIPFLMANNVIDGTVDQTNCSFITEERANRLDKGFARDNDVLITHKGTIGRTAVLRTDYNFVMLTPQVAAYRIIKGITPDYLCGYFATEFFQNEMKILAAAGGSTRAYAGITAQLQLHIIIPPLDEQYIYTDFIKHLDKSKVVLLLLNVA